MASVAISTNPPNSRPHSQLLMCLPPSIPTRAPPQAQSHCAHFRVKNKKHQFRELKSLSQITRGLDLLDGAGRGEGQRWTWAQGWPHWLTVTSAPLARRLKAPWAQENRAAQPPSQSITGLAEPLLGSSTK